MKKTFWMMAAFGLFATCMSSCDGGKDYATDICKKLQGCNNLSLVGATTVAECTTDANRQLNAMPSNERSAADKTLDQCLAQSDCSTFSSCVDTLVNYGPGSTY
jgi:hypothetical protein